MATRKESNLRISRREALRWLALGSMGLVAASCGAPPTPQVVKQTQVVKETQVVEKVVTATPPPAPTKQTFPPGTSLGAVLRLNFVTEMNTLQLNQTKRWAEANGVKIEVVFPNDYREQAAAAAESGAGADIYELFQNNAFVYAEKLVDMGNICEALGKRFGGWYDVAQQAAIVNGVWRAIPRSYTAHAVNYRVDYFEKAGVKTPPKTYDEMLEAGRKLKKANLPLLAFPVAQSAPNDSANFLYSVLWSYGGKEVEKDGKTVAINSPETKAAVDYVRALAEVSASDITAYDDGSNNRNFLAGQIAATNNAVSIYVTALKQAPDVAKNMDHFAYPAGPAGRRQFVEVNLLGLFAHSKNKEAALALLSWLMEEAQFNPLMQFGQTFASPMLNYYEDLPNMPWSLDPKLKVLKGVGKDGLLPGWPGPASRKSGEAFNRQIIINMFARVLAGEAADKSIRRAEEELRSIYSA